MNKYRKIYVERLYLNIKPFLYRHTTEKQRFVYIKVVERPDDIYILKIILL